jgi:molecular chaperone IbpA
MTRTTLDLTPFYRGTIGFERLFHDLDRQFANPGNTGYPPYNILRVDDNHFIIELAVAGFSMEELNITQTRSELLIEGVPYVADDSVTIGYLHKGIANRSFKRVFTIADYVEVKGATLELGILSIELEREIPEELKPRKITIESRD